MTFVVLAGCVAPTPYQAAQSDNLLGYSDQRLAEYRFRVTFRGDSATNTTHHSEFGGWPGSWKPGFGWCWHSWALDRFGGVDSAIPITRHEADAEIILLTPQQAQGDLLALRAEDVIARLGPVAVCPIRR